MGFMTEGVLWSLFFYCFFCLFFKVHRLLACVSFVFSFPFLLFVFSFVFSF